MYQAMASAAMGAAGGGSGGMSGGGQSDWMSFTGGTYAPVSINTPSVVQSNNQTIIFIAVAALAVLLFSRKK